MNKSARRTLVGATAALLVGVAMMSGCKTATVPTDKSVQQVMYRKVTFDVTTIDGTPIPAMLYIDNGMVATGDAKGRMNTMLANGIHRAKILAPGFIPWEEDITVLGLLNGNKYDAQPFNVQLKAIPSTK